MSTAEQLQFAAPAVPDPDATFMDVTPVMAEQWMQKNQHNRSFSKHVASKYVDDIRSGSFQGLNGESIKRSADGLLLDGQHRLSAIIQTQTTVRTLVVSGVQLEAQSTMDKGRKRSVASTLALAGEKNSGPLSALIRLSLVVEGGGRIDPTGPELEHHLAANPSFRDAAEVAKDYGRLIECAQSLGMYGYWRMAQISPADALAFWTAATTRAGLPPGDPILALLYRLSDVRRRKQHLERKVLLSLIFRTWNARRAGQFKTREGLRINSKGGQPYPIPELI